MVAKNTSRRSVLKGAAAAAAVTAFPAPFIHAQGPVTLRYINNGVSAYDQIAKKAEEDLGIKIEYTVTNDLDILQSIITNPNTMDILDIDSAYAPNFHRLGKLQTIDANKIELLDKFDPVLIEGTVNGEKVADQGNAPVKIMFTDAKNSKKPHLGRTEHLVALTHVFNADTLGIRPDLIDRPVKNWRDILDPAFKGKAALINFPNIGIMDAAMIVESVGAYTYPDKGNMSREEIDLTLRVLSDARDRGQFGGFWSDFRESVEFMASGDIVIQSMWSPAVTVVKQRGIACTYQPLEEGYRSWQQMLALPATLSGRKLGAAYEFMNWCFSGWRGAFLQRQGYYSSVHETVKAAMTPSEWAYWIEGKPAAEDVPGPDGKTVAKKGEVLDGGSFTDRMGRVACWNASMDEERYLHRQWRKFARL